MSLTGDGSKLRAQGSHSIQELSTSNTLAFTTLQREE